MTRPRPARAARKTPTQAATGCSDESESGDPTLAAASEGDRDRQAPAPPPSTSGQPWTLDENRLLSDENDTDIRSESGATIVVGHDRSAGANAALKAALQLASELRAPVTIVRAWSIVTAPRPANWTFGYVSSTDELAEAVRAELVRDTRSEVARFPGLEVTYRAYHAGPVKSLIQASRGARMLVVGSRGLGGFREMVLGSVSDQCVRYAHCPVLVTRRHPS